MIIEFRTAEWHGYDRNGVVREDHCCGCWHVCVDADAPLVPYVKCNECGEIRKAIFPGIIFE